MPENEVKIVASFDGEGAKAKVKEVAEELKRLEQANESSRRAEEQHRTELRNIRTELNSIAETTKKASQAERDLKTAQDAATNAAKQKTQATRNVKKAEEEYARASENASKSQRRNTKEDIAARKAKADLREANRRLSQSTKEADRAIKNAQKANTQYGRSLTGVTKAQDGYRQSIERTRAAKNNLRSAQERASKAAEAYRKRMDRVSEGMSKAGREAKEAARATDVLTKGMSKAGREADKLDKELDQTAASTDKAAKSARDFASEVIAATAAVAAGTAGLLTVGGAAAEFEQGLIGVGKTTDLVGEDLAILGEALRDVGISIGTTTKELLETARVAGQLGVQGVDNITLFTETILKLGTASDLVGEEGASALARIINVTDESIASIDTLASIIVALGNNMAATEREITHVANEIARATTVYNVAAGEAAAFGAIVAATGGHAEASRTAFARFFSEMTQVISDGGDRLEEYTSRLGLVEEEFVRIFQVSTVDAVRTALQAIGELTSVEAAQFFNDFNLAGERIRANLLPLAQNTNLVNQAFALYQREAKNATELNREFSRVLEGLIGQLRITRQTLTAITEHLATDFNTELKFAVVELNAALRGLEKLDEGMRTFGNTALKALAAATALFGALVTAGIAMRGLKLAGGLAATTLLGLGTVTGGIVAVGLAALVAGGYLAFNALRDLGNQAETDSEKLKNLNDRLKELKDIQDEIDPVQFVGRTTTGTFEDPIPNEFENASESAKRLRDQLDLLDEAVTTIDESTGKSLISWHEWTARTNRARIEANKNSIALAGTSKELNALLDEIFPEMRVDLPDLTDNFRLLFETVYSSGGALVSSFDIQREAITKFLQQTAEAGHSVEIVEQALKNAASTGNLNEEVVSEMVEQYKGFVAALDGTEDALDSLLDRLFPVEASLEKFGDEVRVLADDGLPKNEKALIRLVQEFREANKEVKGLDGELIAVLKTLGLTEEQFLIAASAVEATADEFAHLCEEAEQAATCGEMVTEEYQELREELGLTDKAQEQAADRFELLTKVAKLHGKTIEELAAENEDFRDTLLATVDAQYESSEAAKSMRKEHDRLQKSVDKTNKELNSLEAIADKHERQISDVIEAYKLGIDIGGDLHEILAELRDEMDAELVKDYKRQRKELIETWIEEGGSIRELIAALKELEDELRGVSESAADTAEKTKGIFAQLMEELRRAAAETIFIDVEIRRRTSGGGDGPFGDLTGSDVINARLRNPKDIGADIGAAIGRSLGQALGGPIGGALGFIGGAFLGKFIGGLFGGGGTPDIRAQPTTEAAGFTDRKRDFTIVVESEFGRTRYSTHDDLLKGLSDQQEQQLADVFRGIAQLESNIAAQLDPDTIARIADSVAQQERYKKNKTLDVTPFIRERFERIFNEVDEAAGQLFRSLSAGLTGEAFLEQLPAISEATLVVAQAEGPLKDYFDSLIQGSQQAGMAVQGLSTEQERWAQQLAMWQGITIEQARAQVASFGQVQTATGNLTLEQIQLGVHMDNLNKILEEMGIRTISMDAAGAEFVRTLLESEGGLEAWIQQMLQLQQSAQAIVDRYDPVNAALRRHGEELDILNLALEHGAISQENYDKAITGVNADIERLTNGVEELGDAALQSAEELARAAQQIIDRYDPVGAQLRRFSEDAETLEAAYAAGEITQAEYTNTLKLLNEAQDELLTGNKALAQSAQDIVDRYHPVEAQTRRYMDELETLEKAFNNGLITTEYYQKSVKGIRADMAKLTDTTEAAAKAAADLTRQMDSLKSQALRLIDSLGLGPTAGLEEAIQEQYDLIDAQNEAAQRRYEQDLRLYERARSILLEVERAGIGLDTRAPAVILEERQQQLRSLAGDIGRNRNLDDVERFVALAESTEDLARDVYASGEGFTEIQSLVDELYRGTVRPVLESIDRPSQPPEIKTNSLLEDLLAEQRSYHEAQRKRDEELLRTLVDEYANLAGTTVAETLAAFGVNENTAQQFLSRTGGAQSGLPIETATGALPAATGQETVTPETTESLSALGTTSLTLPGLGALQSEISFFRDENLARLDYLHSEVSLQGNENLIRLGDINRGIDQVSAHSHNITESNRAMEQSMNRINERLEAMMQLMTQISNERSAENDAQRSNDDSNTEKIVNAVARNRTVVQRIDGPNDQFRWPGAWGGR